MACSSLPPRVTLLRGAEVRVLRVSRGQRGVRVTLQHLSLSLFLPLPTMIGTEWLSIMSSYEIFPAVFQPQCSVSFHVSLYYVQSFPVSLSHASDLAFVFSTHPHLYPSLAHTLPLVISSSPPPLIDIKCCVCCVALRGRGQSVLCACSVYDSLVCHLFHTGQR